MAKRVQISDDNGVTWFTLPGSKAEISYEGADIKDTIFGQDYQSGQTGLIGWMVTANGVYKGFAGYVAKLLKSGTSTPFSVEAMSLVSGKTYKITNATKNVWNRSVTTNVFDNAVLVNASNILEINWLFGQVTFTPSYTPTTPITVTGAYFPMTQIGKAQSFDLTQTMAAIENTDFGIAQGNNGFRTYEVGLRTVQLGLKGVFATANDF